MSRYCGGGPYTRRRQPEEGVGCRYVKTIYHSTERCKLIHLRRIAFRLRDRYLVSPKSQDNVLPPYPKFKHRCMEMARQYPHALVLGIDVSPTPIDFSLIPDNLSFEIDDVNQGLEHFHGQYDVIHMRSVMTGIYDIDKTVEDIQLCLKPGGVIILICADIQIYGEDRLHAIKIPDPRNEGPNSTGSWFHKIIWGTREFFLSFTEIVLVQSCS